jgi:hypothetical protein
MKQFRERERERDRQGHIIKYDEIDKTYGKEEQ